MTKNTVSKLAGLVSVVASAFAGAYMQGAKAAVGAALAAAATWLIGFLHDAPSAPQVTP